MTNVLSPSPQLSLFDIWESSPLRLTAQQQQMVPELQKWLSQQPSPIARFLSGSSDQPSWTVEELVQLERCLHTWVRNSQKSAEMLRILLKVIGRLNEFRQTPLPLPSIPVYCPPPQGYLHKNLEGALRKVQAWREAHHRLLQKEAARGDHPHISLERVVMAAALEGGLWDVGSLRALTRALAGFPRPFHLWAGQVQAHFSLAWQGIPDSQLRSWMADPVTAALLVRLPDHSASWVLEPGMTDGRLSKELAKRIRQLLRQGGVAREHDPSSLADFVECLALAARTELPSVLVNFAARRLISHPVRPDVLLRLSGQASASAPSFPAPKARRASQDGQVLWGDIADQTDYEPRWFRDLRDGLTAHQKERRPLQKQLVEVQADSPPVAARMIEFAEYLASGSSDKRAYAGSTVREYALTVAKRFGCLLDGEDPVSLPLEALEELYLQVLENTDYADAPRGLRPRVARALRWFHHFLAYRYHKGKLSEPGLLGAGRGLLLVDANLISLEEYEKILDAIQSLPLPPDLRRVLTLLVILGFRSGLRWAEALKLQISDVQLAVSARLRIHPWKQRPLKTAAARRNLPLEALLTPQELALVGEWTEERVRQWQPSEDPFLFSVPALAPGVVPSRSAATHIHRVMRAVVGDNTLRYHHLRHSFATWSFLRLMISDLRQPLDLFPHLPKTTAWLAEAKEFRTRLYQHEGRTRSYAHAMASLLGHASPDTSLEHYIHSLDWILSSYLHSARSTAPKRPVVRASGRPASTVYCLLADNELSEATRRLFAARYPDRALVPSQTGGSPQASDCQTPTGAKTTWVWSVWSFLHAYSSTGTPLHELSTEFELEQMERMLARALVQRDMPSGQIGGKRHRMKLSIQDRQAPQDQQCLCCLDWPHLGTDEEVIRLLAEPLRKLIETEPDTCRKVLDRYVRQVWKSRNPLLFRDPANPQNAREYLAFLDRLQIKRRNLRFVSFDRSGRSPWRQQWRKALNLNNRDGIVKRSPPNPNNVGAARWLGIEPVFHQASSTSQKAIAQPGQGGKVTSQPNNNTGSYGFRFLMNMADIFLAGIDTEQTTERDELAPAITEIK